jgi:hypothetical protein
MSESIDWGNLTTDWQNVAVDTPACSSLIVIVRKRARLMLFGLALEIALLLTVAALTIFLLQFLPPTSMFVIWAIFGLLVSFVSVAFRIRNSAGLWRTTVHSTHDMLQLSEKRLKAIARTARFNRGLTIVFSIALPVWSVVVWWLEPGVWLRNPLVSLAVVAFAFAWITGFWIITGRTLRRCKRQIVAVKQLLEEFDGKDGPAV